MIYTNQPFYVMKIAAVPTVRAGENRIVVQIEMTWMCRVLTMGDRDSRVL